MKAVSLFAWLALAVMSSNAWAGPLPVMVSVAPQKYIVEKLAGPLATVDVMVTKGADAHTFEPKPSQMAKAAKARLYFEQGVEFEQVWLPKIAGASPSLMVVDTVAGIERLPLEEHHEHEGKPGHEGEKGPHGHEEMELDPHVWTSPALVKVMAATMAKALAQADPANAKTYQANLEAFQGEMDSLDADIRKALSGVPAGSEFMVFHPAWAYFARQYGLKEVSIEYEGREPGPRKLAELIDHARHAGAKVIFVQPQFSRKAAQTVAQATGAKLVTADPLEEDIPANLRQVSSALGAALRK